MYPYRNSNLSRYKLPIETITLEQTINNPVQTASHRIDGVLIIKARLCRMARILQTQE